MNVLSQKNLDHYIKLVKKRVDNWTKNESYRKEDIEEGRILINNLSMARDNYVKCASLHKKLSIRDQNLLVDVGFTKCDVIPEYKSKKDRILPDGSVILKENKYYTSLQEPYNNGDYDINRFMKEQTESPKLEKQEEVESISSIKKHEKIRKNEKRKSMNSEKMWGKNIDTPKMKQVEKNENENENETKTTFEEQLVSNSLLPTTEKVDEHLQGTESLESTSSFHHNLGNFSTPGEKKDYYQKMILFSPPSFFNKRNSIGKKRRKIEPGNFDINKMDLESSRIEKQLDEMKRSFKKGLNENRSSKKNENIIKLRTRLSSDSSDDQISKKQSDDQISQKRMERADINTEEIVTKESAKDSKRINNIENLMNGFRHSSNEKLSKKEFYEMCSDLKKEINGIRKDSKKKEEMFIEMKKMIREHLSRRDFGDYTTEKTPRPKNNSLIQRNKRKSANKSLKRKKREVRNNYTGKRRRNHENTKKYYHTPSPRRKTLDMSLLEDPTIEDEVKQEELSHFRKQLLLREEELNNREKDDEERIEYHVLLNNTLKRENEELRKTVKKLKREMGERKETMEFEFRKLHALIGGEEKMFNIGYPPLVLRDMKMMNDLEMRLIKHEKETSRTHNNQGYYPKDIHDPIDHAVSRILKNIPVIGDVRIELEKIRSGEYLADRLLKLRLVRRGNDDDQVVVTNLGSEDEEPISLRSYLMELYSPFLPEIYRGEIKKLANARRKERKYDVDSTTTMNSTYPQHHRRNTRIRKEERVVSPHLRRRRNLYNYDEENERVATSSLSDDMFFEYGRDGHREILNETPQQHIVFDYTSHPASQQQQQHYHHHRNHGTARKLHLSRKSRTVEQPKRRMRKKKKKKIVVRKKNRSFSSSSYAIPRNNRYMKPTLQSNARRSDKKIEYERYFAGKKAKKKRKY